MVFFPPVSVIPHLNSNKLRNTAIWRLAVVLVVFLAYGGASLYFNYYFHNVNSSALEQLYAILKRTTYIPTMTAIIRTVVSEKDKTLLGIDQNKGSSFVFRRRAFWKTSKSKKKDDGILYGHDVLERMQAIEAQIKNYEKKGNRAIFKEYFRLSKALDTSEFCALADSFPTPQPDSPILFSL